MVVCSYDFVEATWRRPHELADAIAAWREGQIERDEIPKRRPVAALPTEVWKMINKPWKRLVLDDCRAIIDRDCAQHQAVKEL